MQKLGQAGRQQHLEPLTMRVPGVTVNETQTCWSQATGK